MNPQETASQIIKFCRSSLTERGKIDELVEFLLDSDYFTAPSSTKFHAAFSGGLFLHSYGVYNRLRMLVKRSPEDLGNIKDDTLMMIALFHDLCKVGMYAKEPKWQKVDGKWEQIEVWIHDDMIPLGHGEKSLYILQTYLDVTPEEACAIRWHNNRHETGTHFFYPTGASLSSALEKYPLTKYLHLADLYQTYAYETIYGIYHNSEWIEREDNKFESLINIEELKSELPF